MTEALNNNNQANQTPKPKDDAKGFSLSIGDTYLGYVIINKRLPKAVQERITPEALAKMLKDVTVEEFGSREIDTTGLDQYLKTA